MNKPLIFISHITEEKHIAEAIQQMISDAFLNSFDTFVSSNPNNLPLGSGWHQTISEKLKKSSMGIIIISPKSKKREWINFEAGALWMKDVPVIPACHSGMKINELDYPLAAFQATDLTDKESVKYLLSRIAKLSNLNFPANYKVIDFTDKLKKYSLKSIEDSMYIEFIERVREINPELINLLKKQHTEVYLSHYDAREFSKVISTSEKYISEKIHIETKGEGMLVSEGLKTKYKVSVNPKVTLKLKQLSLI